MPAGTARAHDVPASVVLHAHARAADGALEMVLRVPLRALRDVDVPQRGRGYLDLARTDPMLREAAERWLPGAFEVRGEGRIAPAPEIVALRASLESERVPSAFSEARAQVLGPKLPIDTELPWEQAMVDALLRWPIAAAPASIELRPRVERLAQRVTLVMRVSLPDGTVRAWQLHGDPGFVPLDPGALGVLARFGRSGAEHVIGGLDHLLFIACLAIPVRRLRTLAGIVTAFAVAHSITLVASALGAVPGGPWFAPAVETLIAASILWMAIENILGFGTGRARWMLAFVFGLVHGFGFAFALSDTLQFAGQHLALALLAFNLGIEVGQLAVLAVLVPALAWLLERALPGRAAPIVLSALIAHVAWHWMLERGTPLAAALGY